MGRRDPDERRKKKEREKGPERGGSDRRPLTNMTADSFFYTKRRRQKGDNETMSM